MSHVIRTETYDLNVDKKKVQNFWDEYARHDDYQEGCSGLGASIRWIDCVCDDYNSAQEYIESHDRGWYDQLAVKYRDYKEVKPSKKYIDYQRIIDETLEKKSKAINDSSPKNLKSSLIECKRCGSKLATQYLNGLTCPVCRNDMRSETLKNQLKGYDEKIEDYRKRKREEELKMKKAQEKSATVMWLVKVEWHC